MHLIDQYAYTNHCRRVHPAQKVGLALLVMILCLGLDHPTVGLAAILWMGLITTQIAKIPTTFLIRLLCTEALFLALSVLSIGVSIGTQLPDDALASLGIGSLVVAVSRSGLITAIWLICRTLGCVAALNMLIITTPLVDLIDLARRLNIPSLLIDLMMVIYRSIFVLLASFQRMRSAQESRLGYRTPHQAMQSAALLASRLFIDTYHRAQRLQIGLECRGYHDELLVIPLEHHYDRGWSLLIACVGLSLLVIGIGSRWLF